MKNGLDGRTIDEIDKPDNNNTDAPPAATTERLTNPFLVFRQRNSSGAVLFRGPVIKCGHTTGEWLRTRGQSTTLIGADERFIVNPMELIDTWTKYVNGERIERHVYRVADFEFAPERAALGDMDRDHWEWDGRRRKDPWSRKVLLPMKTLSDGEICVFQATGEGAIEEIGELCAQYASADRGGRLPVIEPSARSYENTHGTTIYVPVFTKVISWAFWEANTPTPPVPWRPISAVSPPTEPASPNITKVTAPADAERADMDDEIPF
jgi:hypothetical protein